MKKTLLLCLCSLLIGCTKSTKFSLEKEYYNESKFIAVASEDINTLKEDKKSFIVFTYNNYCMLEVPCDEIFKKVMDKYSISFLYLPYEEMKNTFIYEKVKLAPSVIIIKDGEIISFLDTEKEEDLNKYQDETEFDKWITKYINTK